MEASQIHPRKPAFITNKSGEIPCSRYSPPPHSTTVWSLFLYDCLVNTNQYWQYDSKVTYLWQCALMVTLYCRPPLRHQAVSNMTRYPTITLSLYCVLASLGHTTYQTISPIIWHWPNPHLIIFTYTTLAKAMHQSHIITYPTLTETRHKSHTITYSRSYAPSMYHHLC